MAIRRTDIDIIIPSATYQQKNDIPVWDAYIEKVVIDGDIPSLGIAGVVKVKVNGLVALLKLITGVAIKSMV